MHSSLTRPEVFASYVDHLWEQDIVAVLSDYVAIKCLSPDFDPAWARNGEIARAAGLLSRWAASRPIPGIAVEIVAREGLTPVIIADVPATPGASSELVTLVYGHLDKQPPLGNWREGLDPFVAVREDDRLYGRGAADDGYSIFAAIGALEALAASDTPHGRCLVLIESSEESGSSDLAPYLDEIVARTGGTGPGLVVCLDSGCLTYDRLWSTDSLRGLLNANLRVDVLSEGIHSGSAGESSPRHSVSSASCFPGSRTRRPARSSSKSSTPTRRLVTKKRARRSRASSERRLSVISRSSPPLIFPASTQPTVC